MVFSKNHLFSFISESSLICAFLLFNESFLVLYFVKFVFFYFILLYFFTSLTFRLIFSSLINTFKGRGTSLAV